MNRYSCSSFFLSSWCLHPILFHSFFFLFGIFFFFFFFSGYLSSFVVLVSLSTLFLPFSYSNIYTLKSTSPFAITSLFFLSSVLCVARTEREKKSLLLLPPTERHRVRKCMLVVVSVLWQHCSLPSLLLFFLVIEKRTQDSFLSILFLFRLFINFFSFSFFVD